MEQSIWSDFLMKQAPVIVVLGLFCYFMGKLLISQLNKKDAMIAAKDEKIEQQHGRVMELYGKAIATQDKCNAVQEQLLEVLKDTKEDINRLSDKIK